ncbi:MAG: hypothetical protein HW389_3590 [Bacteroidetes bacterium]|nr:hypothetical protein [Bacteroidota bacterium]
MDNKPDKPNRTLLLHFALSVFFALLSILASKVMTITYVHTFAKITINMKWMFWLSALLSVAFLVPIVKSLLMELYKQGRLPNMLGWFFRDDVVAKTASISRLVQSSLFGIPGRLILAGIGIVLLTIAVWRSGAIHDTEMDSKLFTIVDAAIGQKSQSKEGVFQTVELLTYLRAEEGNYLRDCLRLVNDLKAAGARVVMLGIPQSFGRRVDFALLKELEKTGIVVFATDYGRTIRIADSTGEVKLSSASVSMSDREVEETYRLVRLRPSGIQNVGSPRLLDVSIEILRKYKGYSNDVAWAEEGGEFRFGDYKIPVTTDGWMYSQDRGLRSFHQFVYVDSTGRWIHDRGGTQFFSRHKTPGLKIAGRGTSMEDIGARFQGKIVLLMESFGRPGGYLVSKAYESAIENIISESVMRKWEQGHLWISVLCLIIVGLIAYRIRLVVGFLILLAFLPCVLLLGWYLYTSQSILVDMMYPLLSTAMAIVVFPVIVMGQQSDPRKPGSESAGG